MSAARTDLARPERPGATVADRRNPVSAVRITPTAGTEAVLAIAEIDAALPDDTDQLTATLTRAVCEQRRHLTLRIDAAPFPATLERQHIAVLLTYRPEQLPGKEPAQVCNYAADLALPGLRRSHGPRARLSITPAQGGRAVEARQLIRATSAPDLDRPDTTRRT